MRLLFPLGLLGLIAVPILIIIYIIKNKYTEQVVSSTYIWTLSEKFLKRRNPISKIAGIISLILQILAVIFISFAIAQPVFAIPGGAIDYCFVLDGSGSMNIVREDDTRLDLGKGKLGEIISSSANGSSYTLVYVTESTEIIYEEIEDKAQALKLLNELTPRYGTSSTVDALGAAQKYFDGNENEGETAKTFKKIYVVTDKQYTESSNVEIINVGNEGENYSISGFELSDPTEEGKLTFDGVLISYSGDATLTVQIYLDGGQTPAAEKSVAVKKLEETKFNIETEAVEYRSARVSIKEKDALALDNESAIYNLDEATPEKTIIVSDTPFFIQAILGTTDVETATVKEYEDEIKYRSGYGLYVFDSYAPAALPSDGAVWFFNPTGNVERAGFTVQPEVECDDPGVTLKKSTDSNTDVQKILAGLLDDPIRVKTYVPCEIRGNFKRLFTYGNSPLIFAGSNEYGNREVVFAFSLHETDQALLPNFVILASNLMKYTFPQVLEKSNYFCGESVEINVPASCDSIKVVAPGGTVSYLDTDRDIADFTVDEVGDYTITFLSGSSERVAYVRADLPMEERAPLVAEPSFNVLGEPGTVTRDGVYDDLLYLFIILAVLFIADWMVYCYEQYQLK